MGVSVSCASFLYAMSIWRHRGGRGVPICSLLIVSERMPIFSCGLSVEVFAVWYGLFKTGFTKF